MPYIIEKTFNSEIFTKVGSPTITADGIASGFSDSNYLTFNAGNLTFNTFEFISPDIYIESVNNKYVYFTPSTANSCNIIISDRDFYIYWVDNGGQKYKRWFFGSVANHKYRLKLLVNSTSATVYCSTDGKQFTQIGTTEEIGYSKINCAGILGKHISSGYAFTGSIDLKQFKITVDGKVVLNGTTSKEVYVLPSMQELKDYYSNTLIVQYHGKPKAKATIEMLVDLVFDNVILDQIQAAFDWETAVGKQLDIIGQWVGVSRSYNIPSMSGRVLFSYPETSKLIPHDITTTEQFGYSDYSTFDTLEGGILRYDDLKGIDSQLNDDDYRVVIGLKIIYNSINHTAGEIDNAIWKYFNHTVYTTWSPHILTYNVPAEYMNLMQICLHKGVLPAPIGTEILLTQI